MLNKEDYSIINNYSVMFASSGIFEGNYEKEKGENMYVHELLL